jgi:uncharacterized membrane protein YagU involved in acid resistance
MSYEDEVRFPPSTKHHYNDPPQDLLTAIGHTKRGNHIASLHRKKQAFLGSRLAGYVVSTLHPSSVVGFIASMTDVERHAELVYAESLYEKVRIHSAFWVKLMGKLNT